MRSGWMPCLALVPAACAVNVCVCVCGGEVASGQGAFLFHPSQFHMHAGGGATLCTDCILRLRSCVVKKAALVYIKTLALDTI